MPKHRRPYWLVIAARVLPAVVASSTCLALVRALEVDTPLPWLVTTALVVLATA